MMIGGEATTITTDATGGTHCCAAPIGVKNGACKLRAESGMINEGVGLEGGRELPKEDWGPCINNLCSGWVKGKSPKPKSF